MIPNEIMDAARELLMRAITTARAKNADEAIKLVAESIYARDRRAAAIARNAFTHGLPQGAGEVISAAILSYEDA